MAGMKFKSFPLMGTWLFGAAFLLSTLWHSIFRDGWGFLVSMLLAVVLLIHACVSLGLILDNRSRVSWRRVLINAVALGAFIPTLALGGFLRDQIFLANLPIYQAVADSSVAHVKSSDTDLWNGYPTGFSSSLVGEHVLVRRSSDGAFTVMFVTRDSSAVGHAGYLYRSDDDESELRRENPDAGFKRLVPNWYVWGD
jgi:hypothetical protein